MKSLKEILSGLERLHRMGLITQAEKELQIERVKAIKKEEK